MPKEPLNTKEHLSKHDREIAAIRTLIKTGMRLLVRNQQQINELIAAQKRTDGAQKRTDAALRALIETRANGHTRRKGNGHA
jgi:hypothetical protein